jgi:inorganic phosphate transporter, PiT family
VAVDVPMIVVVVVVTALMFDFTNGFHDTANAMATSIATGALRPRVAVGISAVLNLAGAFLSVQVAKTISGGLVDDTRITPVVIFAGLVGAILWNLGTWLVGMPSSSSHALFGGLVGAVWVAAGADAVRFGALVGKVVLPALISPVLAGVLAAAATMLAYRLTARGDRARVRRGFRLGQVGSASLLSLAHGTNDAQKTMGVITLTLITAGVLAPGSAPPAWVVVAAGLAIAAGTFAGGWRIIRTLGTRVTDIESTQGFAADTTSATVILTSSALGIPLSTTHVCTGSVFGAGAGRRVASVRWVMAARMAMTWAVTFPSAALVGAASAWLAGTGTGGTVAVGVGGAVIAAGIFLMSRRNPVGPHTVTDLPLPPDTRIAA